MRRWRTRAASRTHCHGHSLLELMIATALGTLLVCTAALLYRSQRETSMLAAEIASMRDAGMTALVMIGQQIEMAGFAPMARSSGDAGDRSHWGGLRLGVFGCDSGVPEADAAFFRCRRARRPSDSIVVRYVDDGVSTWKTASSRATDCVGNGIGAAGEQVVIVNQFHAGPDDRGEPQLYCRGNGGKQPIVAGIERLRMRYWLRGATAPVTARSIAAHEWSDVVAVDLCVVARTGRSLSRREYVDCDGASVPILDGRARQAFSRRVAIRNNERVPSADASAKLPGVSNGQDQSK